MEHNCVSLFLQLSTQAAAKGFDEHFYFILGGNAAGIYSRQIYALEDWDLVEIVELCPQCKTSLAYLVTAEGTKGIAII